MNEMVTIESTECPTCGIVFGMPALMLQSCKNHGQPFYCPNGHNLGFLKPIIPALRAELAQAKAGVAEKEKEIRGLKCEVLNLRNEIQRMKWGPSEKPKKPWWKIWAKL